MGRERTASTENYDRVGSYTSPNRSPRRERYSRTESHSRARSRSSQRYEDKRGTKKPAYGGPTEPLVLDSNIQISVKSKRGSSPVRPNSATRIVTVRSRGDAKSHNSSGGDRKYDREYSRHDREYKSPSPHRRNFSPYRGRRDDRQKHRRYEHNDRASRSTRDRTNLSTDRRHENSVQSQSFRRNEYDRLEKERNSSKRRRYSRDDRSENEERSYSSRKKSYDDLDKSPHSDQHDDSETKEEGNLGEAQTPICGPVPVSVRPPMWGPMGPIPFRPHPILFPPRPPIMTPMGYIIPPRPRFFPLPRPPPIFYPPRPLPPPPTL